MKRILAPVFIMLFIFGFVSPSHSEADIERSIKVGGDNHLPPYMYVNDNGIYKGFSVDLLHALAIELELDIELHPMPWYEIPTSMEKEKIEAILGMTKSDNYSSYYDFSKPYLVISQGIFVRQKNKYIVNLEDLSSVRVAVQKGNIPTKLLKYVDEEALSFVDNQQQGILLLMMGKVDAFVGNRLVGLYTIQKWRQTNFIKLVGEPIEPTQYCFAVKKGNKELLNILNQGLKKVKANGAYEKIYNKWFGEIIKTPAEIWKEIIYKITAGVFIIFIIFLLILRGNKLLKKEVKKQTLELAEANKLLSQHNIKIQKEHRFKQQILDSIFHGVITFEKDGIINFSNSRAKALLQGFNNIDYINLHFLKTPVNEFIDLNHLTETLDSGKSHINKEKLVNLENEERVFSYSLYPLKNSATELNGAILSFKDITTEKKMQENLMHKDKMQSLGQLVAVIAHEIRNPLMAIKTFVDVLPNKFSNINFRNKFLEYVPQELERLNQLVSDLLGYARPRCAKKESVKIEVLVNEILSFLEKQLIDKNITLITDIEKDTTAYVDKQQLKQIFINLLLNSIQAINNTGYITIKAKEEAASCIIEITDTGIGIPHNHIKKVMDPFFTSKQDGTGLGLSICYQLVKENDGEINIASAENKGTTIFLKIPNRAKGGSVSE